MVATIPLTTSDYPYAMGDGMQRRSVDQQVGPLHLSHSVRGRSIAPHLPGYFRMENRVASRIRSGRVYPRFG